MNSVYVVSGPCPCPVSVHARRVYVSLCASLKVFVCAVCLYLECPTLMQFTCTLNLKTKNRVQVGAVITNETIEMAHDCFRKKNESAVMRNSWCCLLHFIFLCGFVRHRNHASIAGFLSVVVHLSDSIPTYCPAFNYFFTSEVLF